MPLVEAMGISPQRKSHQRGLQRVGLGSGHGSAPGLLGMSEGGPDGTQGKNHFSCVGSLSRISD